MNNPVSLTPDEFAALYAATDNPGKVEALTRALRRAEIAALAFQDEPDGGTCNFDAPALDYKACGLTKGKAEQAIADAGLRCFDWKAYGQRHLIICGFQLGQGDRRTAMAEAFCKSLKDEGFSCGMYYRMD